MEITLAVLAVAHARSRPPVAEDAVDAVARRDLFVNRGHELEVVRTERARHPQLRGRPVAAFLSARVDGDPIRMRVVHVLMRGVRVGARDDDHVPAAASFEELTERIRIAHPGASVMQRDRSGIVRDDAAGAQAGGVRVNSREVLEPELRIVPAGIVFDERELRPSHRPIEPVDVRSGLRRARRRRSVQP